MAKKNDKSIVTISKGLRIAGARIGDQIEIVTTTGLCFKGIFTELNQLGIEIHNMDWDKLIFIPYNSIITVMKYEEKHLRLPNDIY